MCLYTGGGVCRLQGEVEFELLDLPDTPCSERVAPPHVAAALWRPKPCPHDDNSALALFCHLQPHQATLLHHLDLCPGGSAVHCHQAGSRAGSPIEGRYSTEERSHALRIAAVLCALKDCRRVDGLYWLFLGKNLACMRLCIFVPMNMSKTGCLCI